MFFMQSGTDVIPHYFFWQSGSDVITHFFPGRQKLVIYFVLVVRNCRDHILFLRHSGE